jgi:hypothetical protein
MIMEYFVHLKPYIKIVPVTGCMHSEQVYFDVAYIHTYLASPNFIL